jgi:hypothetical protein
MKKTMRTLLILLVATGVLTQLAAAAGTWQIVPSPNIGNGGLGNVLSGVAMLSSSDIWSVGFLPLHGSGPQRTLAEHWDGTQWSIVQSPNDQSIYDALTIVAAVSTNDVWAVGYSGNPPQIPERETLVEHWNGTRWSIVPSPSPGRQSGNDLYGIAVASSNDIWAVGDAFSGANSQFGGALTLHWNGSQWSIVKNPARGATLFGATALASNNVWAVGTAVVHWDGAEWSKVPFQVPAGQGITVWFQSVSAVSPTDIWAAGYALVPNPEGSFPETLIEHSTGGAFTIVHHPHGESFGGIKALAANDVWAVGFSSTTSALVEHWNGSHWTVEQNPRPGSFSGLAGVDTRSTGDVWAVGTFNPGSGSNQTLIEHHTR